MALWLFQWPSSTVPLQNLHPATVGFCSSGLGDNPFILTIKSENIVYFRSNKTPGESDGQIRSDEPMNLTTRTTRTLISPQSSEVFVHHFLKKKRLYLLDVFSEVFLLSTLKKRKLWFSPHPAFVCRWIKAQYLYGSFRLMCSGWKCYYTCRESIASARPYTPSELQRFGIQPLSCVPINGSRSYCWNRDPLIPFLRSRALSWNVIWCESKALDLRDGASSKKVDVIKATAIDWISVAGCHAVGMFCRKAEDDFPPWHQVISFAFGHLRRRSGAEARVQPWTPDDN